MISPKYISMASTLTKKIFPKNEIFIFGGSARKNDYGDVDIAIRGVKNREKIFQLYELFEESDFPKTVDLVDFDHAQKSFKDYVLLHEKKIWM